jgi:hypothetical protein
MSSYFEGLETIQVVEEGCGGAGSTANAVSVMVAGGLLLHRNVLRSTAAPP